MTDVNAKSSLCAELSLLPAAAIFVDCPPRPLIWLRPCATLSDAIQHLADNHVPFAPVLNANGRNCIGSIDTLNVVEFIVGKVAAWRKPERDEEICHSTAELRAHQADEQANKAKLVIAVAQIREAPISLLMSDAVSMPLLPVFSFLVNKPLSMLIDVFARGVHRVAFIDQQCHIISICSPFDLMLYIHRQFEAGKYLPQQSTAATMYVSPHDVVSVNQHSSVLHGLETLVNQHVSSVAVTSSTTGQLLADFSTSALIGFSSYEQLNCPIVEYLSRYKPVELSPQHVTRTDTLRTVLDRMFLGHTHRVWLVDSAQRPVGVITATDICRCIARGDIITPQQANGGTSQQQLWVTQPLP
jgi:CBS domain-containing protein